MKPLVIASDRDALIARISGVLDDAGATVNVARSWSDTFRVLLTSGANMILVDPMLPGTTVEVVEGLQDATGARVATIGGKLPPIEQALDDGDLRRWAAEVTTGALTVNERFRAALVGLGSEPVPRIESLAASSEPLFLDGEPGSSALWLARLVHRLSGRAGALVVAQGPLELPDGLPGTVYVPRASMRTDSDLLLGVAHSKGWRFIGGGAAPKGIDSLRLAPLRERPADLRPLLRLFFEEQRQRLGLPWLRASPELYAAVSAHTWPGNEAELEAFVVQAAPHATGASLKLDDLPERVRALLDPDRQLELTTHTYERVAETHLRPIVQRYDGGHLSLYRLVIDATESALIRQAYARAGSQKAAAELLGVARNTLRERVARLDPLGQGDA